MREVIRQLVAFARAAGITGLKIGLCTGLPRASWIASPNPWTQLQLYNDDLRAKVTQSYASGGYGADFLVDEAGDSILGNISSWSGSPNTITDDGIHPNNGGNARRVPIFKAVVDPFLAA